MTTQPLVPCGRLAPTPSGALHLGNVLAFGAAWLSARSAGGRVLLRVEDVDRGRARTSVAAGQREDLLWLGLSWDDEVPPQRDRDYRPWLDALGDSVYRCTCSRRQIRDLGGVYPGTCREARHPAGAARFLLEAGEMAFDDRRWGPTRTDPNQFGDPVLQRRDGIFAYNLAVVADDIADGVSEVVRGADLLEYTAVQVQLWRAFGATPPSWLHAPLVLGPDGTKLAKRHGSTSVAEMRSQGWTPRHIWAAVLPWLGIEADSLDDALGGFDARAGPRGPVQLTSPPGGPGELTWEAVGAPTSPGSQRPT